MAAQKSDRREYTYGLYAFALVLTVSGDFNLSLIVMVMVWLIIDLELKRPRSVLLIHVATILFIVALRGWWPEYRLAALLLAE